MTVTPPELPEALARLLAESEPGDRSVLDELDAIERYLVLRGHAAQAEEIEALRRDVPLWGAVGRRLGGLWGALRGVARRQWSLLGKELSASAELMSLLRRRVSGEIKQFSPDEEALVRQQLGDLFRTVPATAMALAPVPGVAFVTPYVLKKLGLLPSAWREAYLVDRLARIAGELEDVGETDAAERLKATAQHLEARAVQLRDRVRLLREHPTLRLLYDFDDDGVIDDAEWQAIDEDRRRIAALVRDDPDTARWFFTAYGEVEGPVGLAVLLELPLPEQTLIRPEELDRWVPIDLLYGAVAE